MVQSPTNTSEAVANPELLADSAYKPTPEVTWHTTTPAAVEQWYTLLLQVHKGSGDTRAAAKPYGVAGETYIDKVLLTSNQDEHFLIKVRLPTHPVVSMKGCFKGYGGCRNRNGMFFDGCFRY
jgi:hypothetical protein